MEVKNEENKFKNRKIKITQCIPRALWHRALKWINCTLDNVVNNHVTVDNGPTEPLSTYTTGYSSPVLQWKKREKAGEGGERERESTGKAYTTDRRRPFTSLQVVHLNASCFSRPHFRAVFASALGNLRTDEVTAGCWKERERYPYIYRERNRSVCREFGFSRHGNEWRAADMQVLLPVQSLSLSLSPMAGFKSASASSPGPYLSL